MTILATATEAEKSDTPRQLREGQISPALAGNLPVRAAKKRYPVAGSVAMQI